jgi:preprotein translocase subunit SecF
MASFSQFGNDLYTGVRSIDFIGRRRLWFTISAVAILLSIALPFVRGGFTFGIEFTGGSEFQVSNVDTADQSIATDAVEEIVPDAVPRVSVVGNSGIRIQTDQLEDTQSSEVRQSLADAYDVPLTDVTESFIGPSWGAAITGQAVRGLLIFLVLASVFMAIYFRTWKMSVAAMVSLIHDLVITAGVYGIVGFEVTPAAVIGFLTILGYSLYDTVVVFDKIRENTAGGEAASSRTFRESVNLAVNQTLVRSINTSVVAVLPVAAILFIGAFALGAGTLRDIALALLIGTILGTYSTIFVAAPLYSLMREREPAIKKESKRAIDLREKSVA